MSEAVRKSDGTDWLSGKTCACCGKRFAVLYPHLWAYKIGRKQGQDWFCTWKCLMAWETMKGEQKTMGAKAILTEADRNEAVRLAMAGGNPVEFLRTKGLKDPKSSWANIKAAVKARNPELYEKIPDMRKIRKEKAEEPVTVTKQAVINAVNATVKAVNAGKQKPVQVPVDENNFPFLTTGISTPIGEFRYYAKQKYLDWEPIGHDDNVSLNTYEWEQFMKHFPKVLEILGVS